MTSDNHIDILLTKFFSGEALPEEAMELEDWVNASPGNRAYFDHYATLFAITTDITINDKKRIWGTIHEAIDKAATQPVARLFNWRLAGIAASIVLLLATGLLINHNLTKNSTIVYQAEATEKRIVLQDQSAITVLPGSSITMDKEYGISNRKIQLNGSASFSVIHNPSQAMIIDMNRLHVKDLGTRFTILTGPGHDTVSIRVDEGEIAVYDDFGSSENAVAGDRVIYLPSQKKLLIFHSQPVAVIAITKTATATAKAAIFNNKPSPVLSIDTLTNHSNADGVPSSCTPCPPDSADGDPELSQSDSLRTALLIADLLKDKLIITKALLSFKLSNTEFIVNGKLQNDAILRRYSKKYAPASKEHGVWAWAYAIDSAGISHIQIQ